jgi:uncharacterized protein (TIGR03067 family)
VIEFDESVALPVAAAGDSIEGEWKAVSIQRDGKPQDIKGSTLYLFQDGRLTVQAEGKPSADMRYAVDTNQSPHHLNLELRTGTETQISQMIYYLKGDNLAICYAPPGGARPIGFALNNGSNNTLIRMRRVDPR